MVKERYSLIMHIHVFRNGPVTQYKQKDKFTLHSKEPFKKGFKGSAMQKKNQRRPWSDVGKKHFGRNLEIA
ncbi:hypothetical protein ROHU_001188 [Labeo rohita]|uniref:Uncharacterized protein n=1 Tax=Labeo rohita TaxID=84645 RepID=A0A498NDL4_LABRO|nr:hypothetical protein ROHU_005418 [Labeo rohita]RXN38352.1 hypothetical protein ROHU_001188 [Labeo rohita]